MRCFLKGILLPVLVSINGYSQADRQLDSLNKLLVKAPSDTEKINLLAAIGNRLHLKGDYAGAISSFEKITNVYGSQYEERCIDAKNKIAFNYIYLGQKEEAFKRFTAILEESKKINYSKGIGFAYRNYAFSYVYQGEYKKATDYYLKALEVWEKTGNPGWISMGYSDLGINFYYQENYEKAAYYWENCIKAFPDKNSVDYINDCTNLGQAYIELNNYDKAETYFRKARDFYSGQKTSSYYTNAIGGLGNLELKRKNSEKALGYYKEVIKIREENGSGNTNMAITYLNVSVIYTSLNKPKEAVEYGLKGYEWAKKSGDKTEILHAYNNLNAAYAKAGEFEKAYEFSQEYNGLRDTLNDIESQKQINELDKQYQTEKKEKENQLLSKQVELQQVQGKQKNIFLGISVIIVVLVGLLAILFFRQNKQKHRTNIQLSQKNKIIEEQHKDITDSIHYAQRIQKAILPPDKMWFDLLPDSFVLYKPKDILSGDFYWIEQNNDYIYVAAADCTGHGVPGALMSIVNFNLLNKALLEQNQAQPSRILEEVNRWLTISLHQSFNESAVRDGMDIALCAIHKTNGTMQFAGAFNGGYIVKKDKSFVELNGDKKPVGAFIEDQAQQFTNTETRLEKGDKIYIFSDGYADQFGGPKGKKLKYVKLRQYIVESLTLDMKSQKNYLEQKFMEWKGNYEQVDDVLIIGITV